MEFLYILHSAQFTNPLTEPFLALPGTITVEWKKSFNSAIHKATSLTVPGHYVTLLGTIPENLLQHYSQSCQLLSNWLFPKNCQLEHPPEGVPAGSSNSQLMGHFSVEQWNCTSQIMEWPGTLRLVAL